MDSKAEYKLIQKIERKLVQGIREYGLIDDGDHILIGLSGGKDSLALTELLAGRSKLLKPRFKISVVHVVMTNIAYESDTSYFEEFTRALDVPLYIRETSFDPSTDKRKSPCFLCSWNRQIGRAQSELSHL